MPDDWPYDADQSDPLTALRIPIVTSIYPHWHYLVSLCLDESESALWPGARPSDAETALLVSEIAYERSRYLESYWRTLDRRPFDIDGGFNSLTFIKRGEDDWAYRRRTWSYGPSLRPALYMGEEPAGLLAVLDRIHMVVDTPFAPWVEWKAAHPDAFGAAVTHHAGEPKA